MHLRPRTRGATGGAAAGCVALLSFLLTGCAAATPTASPTSEARQVLQRLRLPPGAVPLSPDAATPTPFQSSDLGCEGLVEKAEYWRLPHGSIASAQEWFEHHVPHGFQVAGTGSGGDGGGPTMTEVDLAVQQASLAPKGSRVVVMTVTDGSGTVLRGSAQIVPATGCKSVGHHAPMRSSSS